MGGQVPMARLNEALLEFPDATFSLEIKQRSPLLAEPLCAVLPDTSSIDRVFVASDFGEAAYGFQDVCGDVLIATTYVDLENRQAADAADESWYAASSIVQPPVRAGIEVARVADLHDRWTALFVGRSTTRWLPRADLPDSTRCLVGTG